MARVRMALVDEATHADPAFAPAQWHSGRVMFEGQWCTPEEVHTLVAADARRREYRQLRTALADAPDAHQQLAQWCLEHGLANEERFHWANVLMAEPDNKLARKRLSLAVYKGQLFTREQIAQFEDEAKTAQDNLKRFRSEMSNLCRQAANGDPGEREIALGAIRKLADPAALGALELAVARQSTKTPSAAAQLQLAYTAALANMPQFESTLRLVNLAVLAQREEVRRMAAQSLKPRPETDYVPLLMAALSAPVELDIDVFSAPDGTVRLTETLFQPGAEAAARHTRSVNYETEGALNLNPARENPGQVLAVHLAQAEAIASQTREEVDSANERAAALNARIQEVLQIATGLASGSDVEAWWKAWQMHNELQYADERAVVETSDEVSFVYRYAQLPPPSFVVDGSPESVESVHTACFRAGTLVWTQGGPTPIEQLVAGDLVLSQNPKTGELAYRPVLRTTMGRPTSVLRLDFRSEAIFATRGHRFWVDGRGWAMAKQLAAGELLHALKGPVELVRMTDDRPASCFNLVVDGFHTYFVGKTKLLVHDIGCPAPVESAVPGSATPRRADSDQRSNVQLP